MDMAFCGQQAVPQDSECGNFHQVLVTAAALLAQPGWAGAGQVPQAQGRAHKRCCHSQGSGGLESRLDLVALKAFPNITSPVSPPWLWILAGSNAIPGRLCLLTAALSRGQGCPGRCSSLLHPCPAAPLSHPLQKHGEPWGEK